MTTATPPSRRSGRLKLLLLVAVFIVPILVAIVLNAGAVLLLFLLVSLLARLRGTED